MVVMGGRDPHEAHRVSTPLELFFDLTFAIAFGVAGGLLAHGLAAGHVGPALIGFTFAMFAVVWAWINFSWFASAYDTDDWIFRIVTMVQMVGVLILAMGLPSMFASLEAGDHVDNGLMVAGYVVMRTALIFQWLRAAKQDPARRAACLSYAKYLAIAQIGWIVVIIVRADTFWTFMMTVPLFLLEISTPMIAERKTLTPWHPHHIAERYGLLTIITLGECLLGTVGALQALVDAQGWTFDAALVGLTGTGLAFAMWWLYFLMPSGEALEAHRSRGFVFGYPHIFIFGSIAATGAGLHVYALYLEAQHAKHTFPLSSAGVVATVAIPVTVFILALTFIYSAMVRADRVQLLECALVVLLCGAAIALAALGLSLPVCLVIILLGPAIIIVIDEVLGRRIKEAGAARVIVS